MPRPIHRRRQRVAPHKRRQARRIINRVRGNRVLGHVEDVDPLGRRVEGAAVEAIHRCSCQSGRVYAAVHTNQSRQSELQA